MQFTSVIITFPNGRRKHYAFTEFDFFRSANELEHKEENIIITLDNLSHSFVYETDELSGEMVCKEQVSVVLE